VSSEDWRPAIAGLAVPSRTARTAVVRGDGGVAEDSSQVSGVVAGTRVAISEATIPATGIAVTMPMMMKLSGIFTCCSCGSDQVPATPSTSRVGVGFYSAAAPRGNPRDIRGFETVEVSGFDTLHPAAGRPAGAARGHKQAV